MKKEQIIYGIATGVLVITMAGIIGWMSVRESEKEESQQPIQHEQVRPTKSLESENSEKSGAEVKSVVEADATLEEMDRLANELERGEEASE